MLVPAVDVREPARSEPAVKLGREVIARAVERPPRQIPDGARDIDWGVRACARVRARTDDPDGTILAATPRARIGHHPHLLERGVDVRVIQALLGHDKLETTARYTRVATGMISAVDSPLDDLGTYRRKRRKAGGRASG